MRLKQERQAVALSALFLLPAFWVQCAALTLPRSDSGVQQFSGRIPLVSCFPVSEHASCPRWVEREAALLADGGGLASASNALYSGTIRVEGIPCGGLDAVTFTNEDASAMELAALLRAAIADDAVSSQVELNMADPGKFEAVMHRRSRLCGRHHFSSGALLLLARSWGPDAEHSRPVVITATKGRVCVYDAKDDIVDPSRIDDTTRQVSIAIALPSLTPSRSPFPPMNLGNLGSPRRCS